MNHLSIKKDLTLSKEPILNCIFRNFVTDSLSQKTYFIPMSLGESIKLPKIIKFYNVKYFCSNKVILKRLKLGTSQHGVQCVLKILRKLTKRKLKV